MTGKGPRQARETTITFNEAEDTASVWTASAVMFNKLKRMGYIAAEERDRSASFEIPKRRVTIRAVDRKLGPEHKKALLDGQRQVARNGISSPNAHSTEGV